MLSRFLAVAATAVLLAAPTATRACEPVCCCKTVTCYEKVTEYECRTVCVPTKLCCYDECGRPYVVIKNVYEQVQVPVTRLVAVTNRVKVCY